MQVDYTNSFGDEIKFDGNGDPAAMYDLVIWQLLPSGEMEFATIGKFDETATVGEKKLHIQRENFSWSGNRTEVRQLPTTLCRTHFRQQQLLRYLDV